MLLKNHLIAIVLTVSLPLIAPNVTAEVPEKKEFESVEERRIKNNILQERSNIRQERVEIDLRKKELKTIEEGVDKKIAEIDRKLNELKKLKNTIETLLAQKSAEEQKRIAGLAKIYEKMTPAKAALAMTGLEQRLAADLLENMKVKSAAKILDQISKQKATQLSTTYSTIQLE